MSQVSHLPKQKLITTKVQFLEVKSVQETN